MALGMGEIILVLLILAFLGAALFAAFFFLAKYLTLIGGKTCPHCAEKVKAAAKVCRYCQRDVTGV
ncbi:MAG TPA: hypothetical protein VFY40_20095 [Blastocatellia bacterium]|nr:hypothetical protein [Blastocatellia bacterium]